LQKCPHFISETLRHSIICKGKGLPITRQVGTGGRRGIIPLILNLGAIWGWMVRATPRPFYPRDRRPGTQCTGGCADPEVRQGGCENLASPEFEPRNIQSIASSTTDFAIPVASHFVVLHIFFSYKH